MIEVRLLKSGYLNNEQFYIDFLEDKIKDKDEYFSDEFVILDEAPDFPIYMAKGKAETISALFKEAINTIAKSYLKTDRDINFDETFWHSLLVGHKREYILNEYPQIEESYSEFKNVVIKRFTWENYIYKCVLAAQYVYDNIEDSNERERYIELIIDNLDVYNYSIKSDIFRNDKFILNFLDIIDELGISSIMKSKIKDRSDLGKDERYGRRVIFEFNKSYPVVMAPMMEKDELKELVLEYLGYYYNIENLKVFSMV